MAQKIKVGTTCILGRGGGCPTPTSDSLLLSITPFQVAQCPLTSMSTRVNVVHTHKWSFFFFFKGEWLYVALFHFMETLETGSNCNPGLPESCSVPPRAACQIPVFHSPAGCMHAQTSVCSWVVITLCTGSDWVNCMIASRTGHRTVQVNIKSPLYLQLRARDYS